MQSKFCNYDVILASLWRNNSDIAATATSMHTVVQELQKKEKKSKWKKFTNKIKNNDDDGGWK